MKAGFIGLGHLGKTIAKRLISEGVELIIWNRTIEKARDLNAEIAESPAALISDVSVLFINLFDTKAVSTVLEGDNGILKGDCTGKIIIDTTTNHFESVLRFHELVKSHGGQYLESTILGSVVPASQGALTVLVSGDKSAYDNALPYLQKIGKSIFYLGEPGLATKMKLVNNLVLGSFMATIAEAVAFGEKVGIDKGNVIEILAAGAGNSGLLNAKKDKLLKADFSSQFSSSLIYKDLEYLQELSFTLKRPLFTAAIIKELYGMTYSKGMESLDFSAIYKLLKEY
ncbi:MAG: NAD(P)-dependent oxidoreductase [Methanotrichaceae archaeon]